MSVQILSQILEINPDEGNSFENLDKYFKLLGNYCKTLKISNNGIKISLTQFPIHWDLNKVTDTKGGYINCINENEVAEKYSTVELNANEEEVSASFGNQETENNNLQLKNTDIGISYEQYCIYEFIYSKKCSTTVDEYGVSFEKMHAVFNKYGNIKTKLANIIKKCIVSEDNKIPENWYSGKIILKLKDGNGEKVLSNTRPIICQSIKCKIFDNSIYHILKNFTPNKFENTQKMFHSCGNKIERAYYELFKHHNNENKVSIFFDFKNAYPSINIQKMADLLYSKKVINGSIYNYVISAYSNAEITYKSHKFKWNYGLMQGSTLSNILFILYQNEFFKEIFTNYFSMIYPTNFDKLLDDKFGITQFVDDTRITLDKSTDIAEFCEFYEEAVQEYGFKINSEKTFYIGDYDLKYNNIKNIENPKKYLGSFAYLMDYEKVISILENNTERIIIEIMETDWKNNMKIYFWNHRVKRGIEKELILTIMYFMSRFDKKEIANMIKSKFNNIFIQEYEFLSEIEFLRCNYDAYVDYRLRELTTKIKKSPNWSYDNDYEVGSEFSNPSENSIFYGYIVPEKKEFQNIIP